MRSGARRERRAGQARTRLMSFLCLSIVLYDISLLLGGQGRRRKGSPGITLVRM